MSKPPRWTIAFLRSLERTGSPEQAALDAGIDRTTAYARKKRHADFAEAWACALRGRSAQADAAVQERVGFWEKVRGKVTATMLGAEAEDGPAPSPSRMREGSKRDELRASTALGGKIVRVGPGRWNAAMEERFFSELAATANVRRACAAAGVSTNAVYARRLKRADFRAKWDAVLETGRAAVEMHLVEAAKKSFDPDDLDVGEEAGAKVSVTEAIRIVQLQGKGPDRKALPEPELPEDDIEDVRMRIWGKLERLAKMREAERLAEGWSHDKSFDAMVPPGWVKTES